jgi:6-phosphogluconolactonase (cycloisomerase 2 family)
MTSRIFMTTLFLLLGSLAVLGSCDPGGIVPAGPAYPTLTYTAKILNSDFDTIPGCDGFNQPYYITVSADNRHVYVTGEHREYIMLFTRNTNGALTFSAIYEDDSINASGGIDGLYGAGKLVLSPDGGQAYVAGYWDGAITAFDRDNDTGILTNPRAYRYTDTHINRFYTHSLAVSPDGGYVYAVSCDYFDGGIGVWERDTASGDLTYSYSIKDGTTSPGDDTVCENLMSASDVIVSNDGQYAYVSGYENNVIHVFARNTATGRLTLRDSIFTGLYRPGNIILSPDNAHLYASNYLGNDVSLYARDPDSGLLTYTASSHGDGGVISISCPEGLAVSADGLNVYVSSTSTSSLFCFNRDPAAGTLTYAECFTDKFWGDENYTDDAHALTNAWDIAAVAAAPDGKNVYTVSYRDDSLHLFKRGE